MGLIKATNNKAISTNENCFKPFFFLLFGDIQYGMIRLNKGWTEDRNLLKKALEKANKLKPPLIIALGDLCNEMDSEELQNAQYEDLKQDLKQLNNETNLYVLCGNHDIKDTPTKTTIEHFEKIWGNSYYSFMHNHCCFIILNSAVFYDSSKVPEFAQRQIEWLEETLKKAEDQKVKHKFVFMHHPLAYDDINEEEDIGSVYLDKINFYIQKNRFHIKKKERLVIYELMKKYNVKYLFCAHMHFNKEVQIDENLKQVVISAVGMQVKTDSSGMLVVRVEEHLINHKYYPLEYVPDII